MATKKKRLIKLETTEFGTFWVAADSFDKAEEMIREAVDGYNNDPSSVTIESLHVISDEVGESLLKHNKQRRLLIQK